MQKSETKQRLMKIIREWESAFFQGAESEEAYLFMIEELENEIFQDALKMLRACFDARKAISLETARKDQRVHVRETEALIEMDLTQNLYEGGDKNELA